MLMWIQLDWKIGVHSMRFKNGLHPGGHDFIINIAFRRNCFKILKHFANVIWMPNYSLNGWDIKAMQFHNLKNEVEVTLNWMSS